MRKKLNRFLCGPGLHCDMQVRGHAPVLRIYGKKPTMPQAAIQEKTEKTGRAAQRICT